MSAERTLIQWLNARLTELERTGSSGGLTNPMTTLGDLITGGVAGAPGRLGIGANAFVLTVVAGAPAWAAATGGITRPKVQALFQLPTAL